MKVEQIYTGCLAQGAYYIESNGEAVIIDPLRETQPYLERAEKSGAKIKYVLETHFHADFVSGHLDLSKKTGATIVYGPNANPSFEAHIATDGEELKVGTAHHQGAAHPRPHHGEHHLPADRRERQDRIASSAATRSSSATWAVPTSRRRWVRMTQEDLAGYLYDSLHNKIMTLPDDVLVYPAHGAGSACGKNMSKETFDTLGNQKEVNYALKAATKEQFIKEVTDGLLPPPAYFPQNVAMNKGMIQSVDTVKEKGLRALDPGTVRTGGRDRRRTGAGHARCTDLQGRLRTPQHQHRHQGRLRTLGRCHDPRREAPAAAGDRRRHGG